ncbi:MAG TPA: exodeoxyribonuclease V subunit gamma, partial [Marmoricola sp.]
MTFQVHRAARGDVLAEGLAAMLRDPLPDPFARELVVVPARGVERWLSQRLSHRLGPKPGRDDGVCAAVDFVSPRRLISSLGSDGAEDEDPWAPANLTWPVLAVIDASLGEPWCRTLSIHLGHGVDGEEGELRWGRRFSVARRLARLFTSYAVQRPALLRGWAGGDDGDGAGGALPPDLAWQAELWRRVRGIVGGPDPVERHRDMCERLRAGDVAATIPPRISLFGHTRIPDTEIDMIAALAATRDVHLWLPHPSPRLWQALAERPPDTRVRAADRSHTAAVHPLLATLGRDLRELETTLLPRVDADSVIASEMPDGSTVLHRLQQDIAADRQPTAIPLADDDRSLTVHACHGPARQVEVLREELLTLLADDPSLEPRDIVVMCPDIESYAPLVEAAFGLGDVLPDGHPGQRLRVRLADRALLQTNPLLAVAGRLLDLAGGRAEAGRVLDLLACDPVRRRFAFTDDDMEQIHRWVEAAGVRWAFDAEHRAPFGLQAYVQNTWRFGIDRILAGVALSDDSDRWLDTTLPLDDVGSTDVDLAGRLAEALDRVAVVTDALTGEHEVGHWLTTIADGVESLTAVGHGDEWQLSQLQRESTELLAGAERQGQSDARLRLPDVRALMSEQLAGRPTRANFRTGTLTVCTMTPMRSVPHRVVCLLGIDEGVFPRNSGIDGDNVLTRSPLIGERDPRSEDRQLFLDAILAARDHLVITYSGRNEVNGEPRPPAVPLGELIDAVSQTAPGWEETLHSLQAYDPGNLDPQRPRAFDRSALAGARAALGERRQPPTLAGLVLAPEPTVDVDLDDLIGFFKDPVRTFLRRRLQISLLDDEPPRSDTLPIEVDGLTEWQVGDKILADVVAGRDPNIALQRVWRGGMLPPGQLGWTTAQQIRDRAKPVAEMVAAVSGGFERAARDIDTPVADGSSRRIVGTVTDLHDTRVVKWGYSKLGPKPLLEAWISLLALAADAPGRPWSAGAIGRAPGRGAGAARSVLTIPDDPRRTLADLVEIYDTGMREPLPLPVRTAHAWAEG